MITLYHKDPLNLDDKRDRKDQLCCECSEVHLECLARISKIAKLDTPLLFVKPWNLDGKWKMLCMVKPTVILPIVSFQKLFGLLLNPHL